jgi:hypothetical protein
LAGRSLWLLPEDALLRLWLYDFVTARAFDYAMFALILVNCVAMAYEYPHMDPAALDTRIIYWGWGTGLPRGLQFERPWAAQFCVCAHGTPAAGQTPPAIQGRILCTTPPTNTQGRVLHDCLWH